MFCKTATLIYGYNAWKCIQVGIVENERESVGEKPMGVGGGESPSGGNWA